MCLRKCGEALSAFMSKLLPCCNVSRLTRQPDSPAPPLIFPVKSIAGLEGDVCDCLTYILESSDKSVIFASPLPQATVIGNHFLKKAGSWANMSGIDW